MAARTRSAPVPVDDPVDDIDDLSQDRPKRKVRLFPIIAVLVLFLLIGGVVAVFVLNPFGLRDDHIFPLLREVPVIGALVPGEYEIHWEYVDGEYIEVRVPIEPPPPPPATVTVEEFETAMAEMAAELEAAQAALAQSESLNRQYEETVQILHVYRDFITDYRANRLRFDEMIALGDPNAFAEFYQDVDPETAARIYAEIRVTQQEDRAFRNYARTYTLMNSSEAGEVFTILLATDPMLLVRILGVFNQQQRADVFDEMEPADVAVITRLMVPLAGAVAATDILPQVPVIGGGTPIPEIAAVPVITGTEDDEVVDEEEEAAADAEAEDEIDD